MLTPGHKHAAQVYTQLSTQTHINGASHRSGKILSRTGACRVQQHLLYSYHTRNRLAWTLALPLFQETKESGRRRRRLETATVRDGGMRRQGSDGRTAAHGSWFASATAAPLLTSPRNVPTGQNTLKTHANVFLIRHRKFIGIGMLPGCSGLIFPFRRR